VTRRTREESGSFRAGNGARGGWDLGCGKRLGRGGVPRPGRCRVSLPLAFPPHLAEEVHAAPRRPTYSYSIVVTAPVATRHPPRSMPAWLNPAGTAPPCADATVVEGYLGETGQCQRCVWFPFSPSPGSARSLARGHRRARTGVARPATLTNRRRLAVRETHGDARGGCLTFDNGERAENARRVSFFFRKDSCVFVSFLRYWRRTVTDGRPCAAQRSLPVLLAH
jgi:hypothetical protein